MNLSIHRGTHEIGGSCIEVWTDSTRIVLDIGIPLVDENGESFEQRELEGKTTTELLEADILPPVDGLYGDPSGSPIAGLILSHPHLDHYGFGSFVSDDIPFYLGKSAHKLIDITRGVLGHGLEIATAKHYQNKMTFQIGDLAITPYLMDHSAFDAYALLIEGEGRKIFYTGDFREHGYKGKLMDALAINRPKDVDVLLMEGTNITNKDFRFYTEDQIRSQFQKAIVDSDGLVLVQVSGQNIDRLVSIYKATIRAKRILVLDSYTALVLSILAEDRPNLPHASNQFPGIKVYFYPQHFRALKSNAPDLADKLNRLGRYKITTDEIDNSPRQYVVIMRPGKAAKEEKLERMPNVRGGTFIYSLWKGYLKQPTIQNFIGYLETRGFVIKEIHTSGHADVPTLQRMAEIINPSTIIPIHTFQPDEFQRHFSQPVKVLEDGEVFTL